MKTLTAALSSDLRGVMTTPQLMRLSNAAASGHLIYETSLEAAESELGEFADAAYVALKNAGDVIAVAAAMPQSAANIRLIFLLAARHPVEGIRALGKELSISRLDDLRKDPEHPLSPAAVSAFSPRVAKLVARYLTEASSALNEFAQLIRHSQEHPGDLHSIDELIRRVHNMKGSGGSFGLAPVSRLCYHIESTLNKLRAHQLPFTPELVAAFMGAIDELRLIFQESLEQRLAGERPLTSVQGLYDAVAAAYSPEGRRPIRVLVADGLASERMRSRAHLESSGHYVVVEADSGLHALGKLLTADFDIVIVDSILPAMSGLALAGLIRKIPRLVSIPCVILTDHDDEDDRAKAFAAGVRDYRLKPLDAAALHQVVESALHPTRSTPKTTI